MAITIPLAEILRAKTIDHIVGQEHILAKNGLIAQSIAAKKPLSILLWGPPGVGKTSIARLYAKEFSLPFASISAVFSGIADIKNVIKNAENNPLFQRTTILFIDEIHRFNKAQQDAFLPYLENGTIILIGATTENPSFYLNNALLSRMRVLTLQALNNHSLELLIKRYEEEFETLNLSPEAREHIITISHGDGRYLYNMIENIRTHTTDSILTLDDLNLLLQKHSSNYDRDGDQHYNLISALHKSVRSSDPDAALYWFARMIKGGEDPLFLARRLIRMASEDIGLADPQALQLAIAARDSFQMLGQPEGELALAQVVIYLSLAPKSNATYIAFNNACKLAENTAHHNPPKHILNAPTSLMKNLDYGRGYIYDHDTENGCSGANNFPDGIKPQAFYNPVERGFEREMLKRLHYFKSFRK